MHTESEESHSEVASAKFDTPEQNKSQELSGKKEDVSLEEVEASKLVGK